MLTDSAGLRPIRLTSIVGTRPEAIKIAPIAIAASGRLAVHHSIVATGQQDALFDDALSGFGLIADVRLPPPPYDPEPNVMTARHARAILRALTIDRPDMVLVQGDTTSAFAGALAAHRLGIPIGHVEAGLRSGDIRQPWPEERNRVMIDRLAALLFAPTDEARRNLIFDEDVSGDVFVTGNTGIDALLTICAGLGDPIGADRDDRRLIFLTCHRRENFGAGVENVCTAALRLAARGDVRILCPVHSNRAVADVVRARLGNHPAITLTEALPYRDTVAAMRGAYLILTDSGGIQEEAPALGVPTLVLRDVTERPEGLAAGNLALVGTDPERIVQAADRLLDDPAVHAAMARPAYPFGDGGAAEKILDHIERHFGERYFGERYASRGPFREHPLPFHPVWTKDSAPEGA